MPEAAPVTTSRANAVDSKGTATEHTAASVPREDTDVENRQFIEFDATLNRCPFCGSTDVVRPFANRHAWYHRCRACRAAMASPQPDDEELAAIYGPCYYETFGFRDGATSIYRAARRAWFSQLLEQVEREVPCGRLLDVGSGLGDLLAAGLERGWDVTGVETNAYAVAAASEVAPGATVLGRIDDVSHALGEFDLITCTDVLEHLRSPWDALRRFHAVVRPGGGVYVSTVDAQSLLARLLGPRWFHIHRDHLWYFTREGLCRMVRRAGFDVLLCGPLRKPLGVSYMLEILAHSTSSDVVSLLSRGLLAVTPRCLLRSQVVVTEGLSLLARKPMS